MREAFQNFTHGFPKDTARNDGTFAGHPIKSVIETELVDAVTAAMGKRAVRYEIIGSAGKGDWTQTPWLVLLDPAVTTSVARSYYIAYLLSRGCDRLYLLIGQGCTTLKDAIGLPGARDELVRRARVMRGRVNSSATHLSHIKMDLNVSTRVWRGKLYEAGLVMGKEYDAQSLPSDEEMLADLNEALDLYDVLRREGGWDAEDDIVEDAEEDGAAKGLTQAKRYRQHRTIERERGHSDKVKRLQGTRCRGCDLEMAEVYGDTAEGMCDAHHLVPLETLDEGQTVTFDPLNDFAVLCPSCHRAIHRMTDPSDIAALRSALQSGALSVLMK